MYKMSKDAPIVYLHSVAVALCVPPRRSAGGSGSEGRDGRGIVVDDGGGGVGLEHFVFVLVLVIGSASSTALC